MELIDRADIEKILSDLWKQDDGHNSEHRICYNKALQEVQCELDTLEVKEVDISSISENLATAEEYLRYTYTSNLTHNKPMIAIKLRKAIKELYSAGLFQLVHDERMESLGLKSKGE